ncbi:MAG: diguanylate cyclase [Calothrix sp. MO_167.B42]|nr:diguanylate cyclase [Calothrix sp. MO_167.B42]
MTSPKILVIEDVVIHSPACKISETTDLSLRFKGECEKLIEDSHIINNIDIKKRLQKLGYAVSDITNFGENIISRISELTPNLVLINLYLPGKINNLQVGDIIQQKFNIPVLYLVDDCQVNRLDTKYYQHHGNCISKHYNQRELYAAIEEALYKHKIENRLQSPQKWLTVINCMACAVVVTDNHGCIEVMNPAAELLTGWQQWEMLGQNIGQVLSIRDSHTGEKIENLVQQAMVTGEVIKLPDNCILTAKDGKQIPIGDSIAPIRDRNDKITGTVIVFQDISDRKEVEAQLVYNAFYDSLTLLPNRVLFQDRLQQAFERSKRQKGYKFAVLFLDLDGFKEINDHFGHSVGDSFLAAIARCLESCLRSGDTIARFGGDEFAILLEDIVDITVATQVAQRIHETLKSSVDVNGKQIFTTASIGISLSHHGYEEPGLFLRDADIAMYRAKGKGKANYVVFQE